MSRDILFLFGAGASYGAGDILPGRPPLGSRLFAELAEHYPGSWGSLPNDVAAAFDSGNFESGMGVIHGRYSMATAPLMLQMAVYLVQFRPASGRSLYCELVRSLQGNGTLKRTVLSTLNYDCVLEQSMLLQGIQPDYFLNIPNGIPVLKLHGSCNWFSHEVKASAGVSYSSGVVVEGGIEAHLDIGQAVGAALVNQGLAPVMSLYMEGKPLQISPAQVRGLQEHWKSIVRSSAVIISIGVRPWAADTHIWQPMAEAPGELMFVGNEAEFRTWAGVARKGRSTFVAPYFADAFPALIARLTSL